MTRILLILIALVSLASPAVAQVESARSGPGALEVNFRSRTSTGATDWVDITRFGITDHGMLVRITGAPASVSIALQCSNNGGASSTSTIGTVTDTTAAKLDLTAALCTDIRVNVATLSGGTSPRVFITYSGIGPAAGAANVSVGDIMAGAQPVDDPHFVKCSDGAIAAPCNVTVATALPAGTNAIGKLAANSGVDIGDVDVLSSALPTGAATSAKQDTLQTAVDAIKTAAELIDNAVNGSGFNISKINGVTPPDFDPCDEVAKTTDPFSITADAVIIAATSAKKNYICSFVIVAGAAEIASIVEGTGTVCDTGAAALIGSTTQANGMSFAANGGVSMIGGNATVIAGKTANVDTCLNVSGSNRVSGFVTWVQR